MADSDVTSRQFYNAVLKVIVKAKRIVDDTGQIDSGFPAKLYCKNVTQSQLTKVSSKLKSVGYDIRRVKSAVEIFVPEDQPDSEMTDVDTSDTSDYDTSDASYSTENDDDHKTDSAESIDPAPKRSTCQFIPTSGPRGSAVALGLNQITVVLNILYAI